MMIQYKVFTGTIAEIEAAFNGWAASLVYGVNVNAGPLTSFDTDEGQQWLKEVMYVLPQRSNNGIAVPTPQLLGGRVK